MRTGAQSKRRLVMESVRERIHSGDFQPGDRIPSDSELVREFGVSRPTVAKALQDLEQAGWVKRKTGSGTYVLRVKEDRGILFGLLIHGLGTTEIFEPICSAMAREAQQLGHSLLWGNNSPGSSSDAGQQAWRLAKHYIQSKVGGVFFAPLEYIEDKDAINQQIVSAFRAAHVPVVLLDRDYVAYPQRSGFDLVGVDNRRVGYLITDHLYRLGCERVAFFTRPCSASTIQARFAGYQEATIKHTGDLRDCRMIRADPRDRDAIGELFMEHPPHGIVCGNDVTAGHLLHALDELGIDVPDDVLVAGIDDVRFAELLRVPLTTMRQPCAALGEAAFQLMLDRVAKPEAPPRDLLLDCDLVQRASTVRSVELSSARPRTRPTVTA